MSFGSHKSPKQHKHYVLHAGGLRRSSDCVITQTMQFRAYRVHKHVDRMDLGSYLPFLRSMTGGNIFSLFICPSGITLFQNALQHSLCLVPGPFKGERIPQSGL